MKSNLKLLTLLLLIVTSLQAQNKMELKFNFGMTFSKPLYDLDDVAGKGKALQPHLSLEGKIVRIPFGKEAKLGAKLTGVAGMEWANVLSNDAITEVNISMPHLKARVYPLTTNESIFDFLDHQNHNSILLGILQIITVNSLHFDYGVAFGKLEEVSFLDDESFVPETVNRTMTYTGWGLQPQIYQSDNEKWTANAFFDFGKYKWENANGRTSGLKTNSLGFGIQYAF